MSTSSSKSGNAYAVVLEDLELAVEFQYGILELSTILLVALGLVALSVAILGHSSSQRLGVVLFAFTVAVASWMPIGIMPVPTLATAFAIVSRMNKRDA